MRKYIKKPAIPTKKHIPQRSCVACRQVRPKRELVRLVRTADGIVEVDLTGKKAGRGAYLCAMPECWEIGLNGNHLEYTLRTTLNQANREQLMKYSTELKEPNSDENEQADGGYTILRQRG